MYNTYAAEYAGDKYEEMIFVFEQLNKIFRKLKSEQNTILAANSIGLLLKFK